jgi:hypothetical protein
MFWNKNKKQIPQETQKCNVDQNLTECLSVSNLRKYQQELKELEYLNIPYLIAKYFKTNMDYMSENESYEMEWILRKLISYSLDINFESLFRNFGKEMDKYINDDKLKIELNKKIAIEKQKLGIE